MGMGRRFTKEYKQESVQLVARPGVMVAQAPRANARAPGTAKTVRTPG